MKEKISKEDAAYIVLSVLQQIGILFVFWMIFLSFIDIQSQIYVSLRFIETEGTAKLLLLTSGFVSVLLLCFKAVRLYTPHPNFASALKIAPFFILLISSLPALDTSEWGRTAVLSLGIALQPFLLAWGLYNPFQVLVSDPENDENNATIRNMKKNNDYIDVMFLSIAELNMCLRYMSRTINQFNTNWAYPLLLLVFMLHLNFFKWILSKQLSSKSNPGSPIKGIVPHTDNQNLYELDFNLSETTIAYAYAESEYAVRLQKSTSMAAVDHQIVTNTAELQIRRNDISILSRNEIICLFISGCINGCTLGMLVVVFLWFFNTPTVLPFWAYAGKPEYTTGILVVITFAIGQLLCIIFNPENLYLFLFCRTTMSKEVVILLLTGVFAILTIVLITATILIVNARNGAAFCGGLLYCLTLPYIFSVNVNSVIRIVSFANNDTNSSIHIRLLPGLISFSVVFGFSLFYVSFAFVIIPLKSFTTFFGKMYAVLWLMDFMIILSLAAFLFVLYLLSRKQTRIFKPFKIGKLLRNRSAQKYFIYRHFKLIQLGIFTILLPMLCFSIKPFYTSSARYCLELHSDELKNVSNAFDLYNSTKTLYLNVLTWTLSYGYDVYGRDNLRCVAQLLGRSGSNIVGLQQSDGMAGIWGGRDILWYLSGFINTSYYPGVEPIQAALGVGFLTNLQVTNHQAFILPLGRNDRAFRTAMVSLDCLYNEQPLRIINTQVVAKDFYGKPGDPTPLAETVQQQLEFIASQARNEIAPSVPTIIIGYFSLNPTEKELNALYNDGFQTTLQDNLNLRTLSTSSSNRGVVNHIFYKGLNLKFSRIFVETGKLSKFYPVVALFEIPA